MEVDDLLWKKSTFNGRSWPTMGEDSLCWKKTTNQLYRKTTFDWRWLRWEATFDGRPPLMEDTLWLKTPFDWRHPLIGDALWWEMPFDGRQPLMGDNLWWETIFDGRWPFDRKQVLIDVLWRETMRLPLMGGYLCCMTSLDGKLPLMG